MATNRLLPQQFYPGNELSATRIEQALLALCALYDDVPADLVQRRWSPSPLVWTLLPPQLSKSRFFSTVAGAFVPGDTARLTINGVNYDYIVLAGDTPARVAQGIVAAAAADPLYIVTSIGAVVTSLARSTVLTATVTSLFLAGVGTFVTVSSPTAALDPNTNYKLPWLDEINSDAGSLVQPPTAALGFPLSNVWRAKSTVVPIASSPPSVFRTLMMEVTLLASHPMIIGDFTVMAELNNGGTAFRNPWRYGAAPPAGKTALGPADDFTLQVCISDAWDLENRKKLRQESLIYQMRSDAFAFSASGAGGALDVILPTHPQGAFNGFAVAAMPLILVPAGGRVLFQWSIPVYTTVDEATWGPSPWAGNAWNLSTRVWSPTR